MSLVDVAHGENPDARAAHIFFLNRVNVAHSHQHAVLRLHLGREIENIRKLTRTQPHKRGQRHPMHIATRRRFGSVDVSMRIDPDEPDPLVLPPVKLRHSRNRSRGHRMIPTQR
jgi:hypothetical protein